MRKASQRKRKGRHRTVLVAAGVLFSVLLSSLFVPALAFAISRLPFIGTPYQRILRSSGLATAYQAGLINELNRSVSAGGYTMTVLSAYADSMGTTVVLKFKTDEPGKIREFSNADNWPEWGLLGAFGWRNYGGGTSFGYNEAEDAIYGWIKTETPPWWVGSRLTIEAGLPDTAITLRTRIPIYRIWGDFMVPRFRINQTVSYKELRVNLNNMVFLPTQTVLNFHSENYRSRWELRSGGRSYSEGSNAGIHRQSHDTSQWTTFYPVFYPHVPDDIELALKGYEVSPEGQRYLPLQVGSKLELKGCAITVGSIEDTAEGLKVTITWSDRNFEVWCIELIDPEGKPVETTTPTVGETEPRSTRVFPGLTLDDVDGYQLDLWISQFIPADEEIVIKVGK